MPDETLLSAARRAVRFFMIDMGKGGLITPATEAAMQTLDRMWRVEAALGLDDGPPSAPMSTAMGA